MSGSMEQDNELQSATIMMVDDEPTTLDVIEAFLQGEGYEQFVRVTDSREALDAVAERRPDVLLLDLMMPHVGGLEILERLRADPVLKHTPVVILTSSTDGATKLKALELGATDFLGKPVDASELALRIRNTLTARAYHRRLAYFDELTGLPNRSHFVDQLAHWIDTQGDHSDGALLHIKIDRFAQIEDGFGRVASNELLKAVASRIASFALSGSPHDPPAVARVGRDDFLVFVPGAGAAEDASTFAQTTLARLSQPYSVSGRELSREFHCGLALFPDDQQEAETLLESASIALSHSRENGQARLGFYDDSLNRESRERVALEADLQLAGERRELQLHYQPKVDVASGEIVGAEALMRWEHSRLGWVPPDRFIPIAEDSDLIVSLGTWAMRTACWQIRSWLDAGFPPVQMAINVSGRQFASSDLLETVRSALDEFDVDGRLLTIELTESMILENPEETARTLDALKLFGITISVDDFGTGFSSLTTLKQFPIDELKIDRSFVKGIPEDADDCAIVAAVIAMGHALGLTLVAEGVETEAQRDFLHERGCQKYQGFYFSKALPGSDWPMLLRT